MPAASFSKDATVIPFGRAPQRPQKQRQLLQGEERSTGGDRFGGTIYRTGDRIPLQWSGMSKADLDLLKNFFVSTVGGMSETFTYTDADGTALTVRFIDPQISTTEKAYERFDVSLTLEVA